MRPLTLSVHAGRQWLLAGLVAVALVAAGVYWLRPAPDRMASPFRNTRPNVQYVGDAACAACHQDLADTYARHPMAHALAPVAAATPIERFDAPAHNPFTAGNLTYAVEKRNATVIQQETVGPVSHAVEVHYALGSGARARSYLVNRDGHLFQAPLTWYPNAGRWDLSPSYDQRNQHFGRPVAPGCLFCHCNQADPVPHAVNRYRDPIFSGHGVGCERCHGPGELHVRRHTDGPAVGIDDTIVNPARLPHALREDVCNQCHLQGEQRVVARGRGDFDYRPGLPLHRFLVDFVDGRDRGADAKFVGSVEQMTASRCYQASGEPKKLGCVSCHDPHKPPKAEEKVPHYRQRCLQCHADKGCSLPVEQRKATTRDDSCIVCHMPPTGSEVNHTSITDHRIPRRRDRAVKAQVRASPPGPTDLVPFARDRIDLTGIDHQRDHGMALMAMLNTGPPDAVAREFAAKALPLLTAAVKRDPADLSAMEARGDAELWLGRGSTALASYEAVLARRPDAESTLDRAANVALQLDHPRLAQGFLERLVAGNPWRWHYHQTLARAAFRQGDWATAGRAAEASLRLEPFNTTTRSLLVQCLLAENEAEKARSEYETIRQLTPEKRRDELRRWFETLQQNKR